MRVPGKEIIAYYLKHYLMLSAAFVVMYGGSNYLASLRDSRFQLYWSIESRIPFVPQVILIYLSVFLIFILPIFYLNKTQIGALARAFMLILLAACTFFVLMPADLLHERPSQVDFLPGLFQLLYTFALPHNLVPSLHIAFTVLFLSVCISLETNKGLIAAYIFWGLALSVSVLLLRQHQLIDIPTGAFLGWVAFRIVFNCSLR